MSDASEVQPPLTILLVPENPTASLLLGSVRRVAGTVILVSSPDGLKDLSTEHLSQFFKETKALNADRRLLLAAKDPHIRGIALRFGWETLQNLKQLNRAQRAKR